jgi:tetratricopeptide (TPR) repeat protein
VFPRRFALALVLTSATTVVAQPAAECPTSECSPSIAATPRHKQLWQEAAAIHQIKVAFVDALQRFLRAQAGTFGDEGDELRTSLAAMQETLTRWDRAIQAFQAQASRTRDAESSIALATVLLDRHRIDDAVRALAAAEQLEDGRVDLYAMRALAYGASKRPDEAVRALRRAAALDTRDPTLAYSLVQRLTELKRVDEAAQARRTLQRSLEKSRRVSFARVDLLSQAPGTAPIFPQARYAEGFSALASGDYRTALDKFADAIARDPVIASAPDVRAQLVGAAGALRNGQLDAALRELQSAVSDHPNDPEIHRLLGLVYLIDDQSGRSIEHLRSAIRLAPAEERARVLLSDVLVGERRLAEGERELMLAEGAGIRSGQISYRLAQLYQRQSLLPQAAQALQDSEAFAPIVGRDRFYQEWGRLLVNRADFDGAVAAYTKRIDVNANSGEAHRQLGEVYFLQGHDEEALAEFRVAVWLDPKDAKSYAAAGQVHVRLARWPDAIAALQRALAIDGSLREARYALGTVLMRTGKVEDARRELDLFSRQQADAEAAGQRDFQLDSLRRQAAKEALAGHHERALALYHDTAALDPTSARSRRDIGLALLRAKRFNEALEHLSAAQQTEETAEGYAFLIDALVSSGNPEQAERQRALYRQYIVRLRMERIRELGGR